MTMKLGLKTLIRKLIKLEVSLHLKGFYLVLVSYLLMDSLYLSLQMGL